MKNNILQYLSGITLSMFLASQVLLIASFLLIPKPVEAQLFGIPGLSITLKDIERTAKEIGKSFARNLAVKSANKFLTRFVDKLVDKYKIRNYLYYDQVLSNWYLGNYIEDKIGDPDLQAIYRLMYAGYISGEDTNLRNQPDRTKAIASRLKQKITKLYVENGGIPEEFINNPPSNISGSDYYLGLFSYYTNPPSFTEQNLRGQFGALQSVATTAAQLEVLAGTALKSGRSIVGGTCGQKSSVDGETFDAITIPVASIHDPATCEAAGGQWNPSALDKARSFIDNPVAETEKYLGSAIDSMFKFTFDPQNYNAAIGSLLADFVLNNIKLKTANGSGVLVEDPSYTFNQWVPSDNDGTLPGIELDIDGDGVPDGIDTNGDGELDICTYGGAVDGTIGPPCKGSAKALEVQPPAPSDQGFPAPDDALTNHPDQSGAVAQAKSSLQAEGVDLSGPCGAFSIVSRTVSIIGNGAGFLSKPAGNNCNGYATDIIAYPDGYIYDVLGDGGNGNNPQWNPTGCPSASTCPNEYRAP